LSISYGERFKESSQDSKDELIFQTTRLINCANFRNIIGIDFLKGLMGLSAADPNPNVDVLSVRSFHQSKVPRSVEVLSIRMP